MNDGLLLFGKPYKITDRVIVNNPTVEQIFDFGEDKYFSAISNLVSTAWNMRLFLYEEGQDYTKVSDYEVFIALSRSLTLDDTRLILGDELDLSELIPVVETETERVLLVDSEGETIFDEQVYLRMAQFIRKCHHMKRIFRIPGNEATMIAYMEEARRDLKIAERQKAKKNGSGSTLAPLISALCNKAGFKYNYNSVRDLSIYAFMDAVYRLQVIDQYEYLMSGIYSGMMSVKGSNVKKELDWMRELN